MTEPTHYHLAWYGHTVCREPACAAPRSDPALDRDCVEPGCDGDCDAARHNRARRTHLEPRLAIP